MFSLLRQWAGQCRERLCPPSSYSVSTRSSHTLVDAAACVGFAALTFVRRTDVFHRVVALEPNAEWAEAMTANAALYQRSAVVSVRRLHLMRFFEEQYEHDSARAAVYWDTAMPTSPALTAAASGDDLSFEEPLLIPETPSSPPRSFRLLSECVRHLLSHPAHPVPLLLLKLPASLDVRRLSSLARTAVEERHIGRRFGLTFLILAGAAPLAAPTPSIPAASLSPSIPSAVAAVSPYGDPSIAPASSRRQLHYLYSSQGGPRRDLYQRLRQVMNSQLWGCPAAQNELWRFFNDRMGSSSAADDEATYDALRLFYHRTLLLTPECAELRKRKSASKAQDSGDGCGGEDGRANSRVRELVERIRRHRFPSSLPASPASMLDVGCSEGSITAALATALSIPPSAAHGCDVRELPRSPLFSFRLVSGSALPYADGSIQLVLALMSLHHIEGVEASLREIRRVLVPGGLLLLREHDLAFPQLSALLDVMHGLYARVWSEPPEQPHFCSDYFAHYRPRGEWQRLLQTAGLQQSADSDDRRPQPWDGGVRARPNGLIPNPFCFYYAAYTRPELSEPLQSPLRVKRAHGGAEDSDADDLRKRVRESADADSAALTALPEPPPAPSYTHG